MRYHVKLQVCSDQFTVHFFIATLKKLLSQWSDTVINAKRVWFIAKMGVVAKNFAYTLRATVTMPPNRYRLPIPMGIVFHSNIIMYNSIYYL